MKLNPYNSLRKASLVLMLALIIVSVSPKLLAQKASSNFRSNLPVCNDSIVLNCENNFATIQLSPPQSGASSVVETCLGDFSNGGFTEHWISVYFSGAPMYYLDAHGANIGLEIYSGTCDNLQLKKCEPATGEDTFTAFYPPVGNHYLIRLMAYYTADENDEIEVFLNCYFPGPACTASIENVELASCVNEQGNITGIINGTVAPLPVQSNVYVEVMTNKGFYTFSDSCHGTSFAVPIEVQGAEITFLMAYVGDSENGCGDSKAGIVLPAVNCDADVTTFNGSVDWNDQCQQREAELALYLPSTNSWVQSYASEVTKLGRVNFEFLPIGTFDIYLTIDGFLTRKYAGITIAATDDIFDYGQLIRGDINGDNEVSLEDYNILASCFFTNIPLDSEMKASDQNCDGFINIIDFSILGQSLYLVGDTPLSNVETED